jgi:hypothetical protein
MTAQAKGRGPAVVFLGPTLAHADARRILDAVFLPPAAQGSIVRAVLQHDPGAILIIDGTFQGEPAVRHKEILWALSRGVPVIGAASMGALRATELFPHMQGVGLVYRWYRRFVFAPDDAVAVLHGPPEVNSAAVTLAEIDLRVTFRAAERSGVISSEERSRLSAVARQLNFRERTMGRIVAEAFAALDNRAIAERIAILNSAFVHQKKRDAMKALDLLKAGAFAAPPRIDFVMTNAFARDLEDSGLDPTTVTLRPRGLVS